MARRSLLARVTGLPVRLGERMGLLDHVPPGLPEGAPRPRHTFRWDLDKTYLRTEFDSLRDLAKNAIETASDKQAYPGATALLRALRQDGHRICIVSGSPTQMRQVLAAKLALDGVEYDEFVLKHNLRNLLKGRFRALKTACMPSWPSPAHASPSTEGGHAPSARQALFVRCYVTSASTSSLRATPTSRRGGARAVARGPPCDKERVRNSAGRLDDVRVGCPAEQRVLELS